VPPDAHSRRAFLGMCGAAAAAVALPGCGDDDSGGASRRELDAGFLNVALRLEHVAVVLYADGRDLLRGSARRTAGLFLDQEREHVRRLARTVRGLGAEPAAPRTLEEYRRSFPLLRRGRDVLRFAVDLENRVIRAYVDGLAHISDPRLRRLAGEIAATEAEQVAVLLGELGEDQLPTPFVTGTTT
jgi:rubrerythrin